MSTMSLMDATERVLNALTAILNGRNSVKIEDSDGSVKVITVQQTSEV